MLNEDQIAKIVEEVIARLTRSQRSEHKLSIVFQKSVITAEDVSSAISKGCRYISAKTKVVVTPLAQDMMRKAGISLAIAENLTADSDSTKIPESSFERVALGSDHSGYAMKEAIKKFLKESGRDVVDFGTSSTQPVDYPDISEKVANAVSEGECGTGIVIDGGGFASAIVCNKVPGVYAAVCWDTLMAREARSKVGANLLSLGAYMTGEPMALQIVKIWLDTAFAGGRHQRRLDKIKKVEDKNK